MNKPSPERQGAEAVRQLAGRIAHELNNCLGVAIGQLDVVNDKLQHNKILSRRSGSALRAVLRGAELVKRLQDLSHQMIPDLRVFDVVAAVDATMPQLGQGLDEDVSLELVAPETVGLIRADIRQFELVLLSLTRNARDAMPSGGKITIRCEGHSVAHGSDGLLSDLNAGRYVLVSVSDDGKGIVPEDLPRVFEPFYTTKARGQGIGLGLAIIHAYMKQCGGTAEIRSHAGRGTTVRLYFPEVVHALPGKRPVTTPGRSRE